MATLLFDDRHCDAKLELRGDSPWIPLGDLEGATGWHLEERGVCQGAECIPVPSGASWRDGEAFDLGAFAVHRGQGSARNKAGDVWSFGPPTASRLATAEAPDFTLPDFEGRMHSLSQYRGKKVVLMTWASW